MGAGGAARGVLGPLLALRPAELLIANRTPARAEELADAFADLGPIRWTSFEALTDPFDLIVNATSASLAGDVPPLVSTVVHRETTCYDMAYGAGGTAFTHFCRTLGATNVHMGTGMLIEQAAEAFRLWHGVYPETAAVRRALEAELGIQPSAR
jgi:shikimate dehydrogenase